MTESVYCNFELHVPDTKEYDSAYLKFKNSQNLPVVLSGESRLGRSRREVSGCAMCPVLMLMLIIFSLCLFLFFKQEKRYTILIFM